MQSELQHSFAPGDIYVTKEQTCIKAMLGDMQFEMIGKGNAFSLTDEIDNRTQPEIAIQKYRSLKPVELLVERLQSRSSCQKVVSSNMCTPLQTTREFRTLGLISQEVKNVIKFLRRSSDMRFLAVSQRAHRVMF